MQIFKTRQELEAAVGSQSIGHIAFGEKSSASLLHQGHIDLIDYSKANFDKTLAVFWNTLELVYELYGNSFFLNEIGNAWDSTGCIDWCEAQGIDYVLIPDVGYSHSYLQYAGIIDSTAMPYYLFVDGVWGQNNYIAYEPTPTDVSQFCLTLKAKTFVILQNWKKHYNNTFVSCWKDGYPTFTMAHYVNNYTPENYVVLDPIKTPDGLYYSSAYPSYTADQKTLLLQVESVVDSVGYDDSTALIYALEDLNTGSENFSVQRVDVMYGGVVGAANDFINIVYTMGSLKDTYPIYKKGVR